LIFSRERANLLAWLTTGLLTISFWHIQMTRNAHRDTLLPLVEGIGYLLLWRAIRTRDWKMYVGAGGVIGLAIYTYSPGRFVGVFVALFVIGEFLVWWLVDRRSKIGDEGLAIVGHRAAFVGLMLAGFVALVVMLPLGVYFAQNPAQFSRRFDSTSIFDQKEPAVALASSVAGNLAQFVVPGAGYQSKHYNLPGKPMFDLFIAPWFVAGVAIAFTRLRKPEYRFLLLWFVVMCIPAFLTADMIPKGVRVFGVVPGVFVFPALAMDWLIERALSASTREAVQTKDRFRFNRTDIAPPHPFAILLVIILIVVSFIGSTLWTTYDYFIAWANRPDLPLAFDADQTEVAAFINQQPATQPIHISYEVYRAPTLMLLGERVPTSRYIDRATRFKESDARTTLIENADAVYIFVRDHIPADEWLVRFAPQAKWIGEGKYFHAARLGEFLPPQKTIDASFNPWLKLIGVSSFADEPRGIVLHWQVVDLPADRHEIDATLSLLDKRGNVVTQDRRRFGAPPLEWSLGEVIVEWYAVDVQAAESFSIELKRNANVWKSPAWSIK